MSPTVVFSLPVLFVKFPVSVDTRVSPILGDVDGSWVGKGGNSTDTIGHGRTYMRVIPSPFCLEVLAYLGGGKIRYRHS